MSLFTELFESNNKKHWVVGFCFITMASSLGLLGSKVSANEVGIKTKVDRPTIEMMLRQSNELFQIQKKSVELLQLQLDSEREKRELDKIKALEERAWLRSAVDANVKALHHQREVLDVKFEMVIKALGEIKTQGVD